MTKTHLFDKKKKTNSKSTNKPLKSKQKNFSKKFSKNLTQKKKSYYSAKSLNTREKKELFNLIDTSWGINSKEILNGFVFFITPKNRIYIVSGDLLEKDYHKLFTLNLNSYGIYFANKDKSGIRLTIEGSQLIGKYIKSNIIKLNEEQTKRWISGEDLIFNDLEDIKKISCKGSQINTTCFIVVMTSQKDFIGSGKISKKQIMGEEKLVLNNYIPKARRISMSNLI